MPLQVLVMDTEGNASGSQGGDNSPAAWGTVRYPRLHVHNKEKSNEKIKLKNRRKGSKDSDEEDLDFAPTPDDEVSDAAEGSNRKRRRNQIPNASSDPPRMMDDEAHLKRRELGAQICGSSYNPNVGIKVSDIEIGFKNWTLTGDLRLRAFFMCAFQSLLFSNTNSYIRLKDVRNTEDLENIGRRNWCKVVVDNLSKAARLYEKDFVKKASMHRSLAVESS
ncbi:uncharacterized protein C2845_PM02G16920 [Panicum miliaceum]|uniref:Uncharacterized protein n=1 Tax=Panicum miliaceum TaxID=4540 RepID=A0A3L6SFT0_PANMI|nr:uncharacterized protein C2845_PM02G16920 [Panicum miliaceum]